VYCIDKLYRQIVSTNCIDKLCRQIVSRNCIDRLYRQIVSTNYIDKLYRQIISTNCIDKLYRQIVSTNFRKILNYQISWKSVQCKSSCSLRAKGRTDMTKLIINLRSFFFFWTRLKLYTSYKTQLRKENIRVKTASEEKNKRKVETCGEFLILSPWWRW